MFFELEISPKVSKDRKSDRVPPLALAVARRSCKDVRQLADNLKYTEDIRD